VIARTFLNFFPCGTLPEHLREFPVKRGQRLARRQPGSGRHNCAPSCDHHSLTFQTSPALIQTLPRLQQLPPALLQPHCLHTSLPSPLSAFQQFPLPRIYTITSLLTSTPPHLHRLETPLLSTPLQLPLPKQQLSNPSPPSQLTLPPQAPSQYVLSKRGSILPLSRPRSSSICDETWSLKSRTRAHPVAVIAGGPPSRAAWSSPSAMARSLMLLSPAMAIAGHYSLNQPHPSLCSPSRETTRLPGLKSSHLFCPPASARPSDGPPRTRSVPDSDLRPIARPSSFLTRIARIPEPE
jgi:hypothetical protein